MKDKFHRDVGGSIYLSRLYEEKLNNQGSLMKIVEYNNVSNIVVEFQDEHKHRTNTTYGNFKNGCIRNPYYPSIYGIGITGCKYPTKIDGVSTKEYNAWIDMLKRCFIKKTKEKQPAYKDVSCCDEWLNFEVFCDWLHSQSNYSKWKNGHRWAIDKDILVKGNKMYSPDTCCLVPQNVNCLFLKRDASRGKYPIGVRYEYGKFKAVCQNSITGENEELGYSHTVEGAFNIYKNFKESIIKTIAKTEYDAGNITERCYHAMLNYKFEIND